MTRLILYALGALAFVAWAIRRLYLAWSKGYVTEVDDPMYGVETAQITRAQGPRKYWISVTITSVLLLAALVFLYFVLNAIFQGQPSEAHV